MITNEEKEALNKVSGSLKKDGQRYEVAVPWVNDRPKLTNNYEMVSRLKNSEGCYVRELQETFTNPSSAPIRRK